MSAKLSFIGVLAAVLLAGPGIAKATLTSPTAVPFFSGAVHPSNPTGLGPDKVIDGDIFTFSVILTDTPDPEEIEEDVTGHMVFDMGAVVDPLGGVLFTSRVQPDPALNPADVSFFYYVDDDPSNNAVVDDIEGDADIVLIAAHTFAELTLGDTEAVAWAASPSKRYIGMRVESGYEVKGNYQIGEIEVDVVPEPGTFALLVMGLLGLAGYGWRKRQKS